ncbi:MAG: IclR family transcriptional regulator [Methylobacteriaceae bacterium]|nr:IclR family transcriptional regulator [Methylobacteriaceae bacterium]
MNQSAAKRALLVLEHLTGRPEGVALTEICEALDLPKSIGHRLLVLLVEAGFVSQVESSGRYRLTLKLTMLGLRHYVRTGLDDLAQPILDRLAKETGELARLAIVDGERLVWVAKAQGARSGLRYDPDLDHDTGHDVVLHATATGKAWLATLPEAEAMRIVAATQLRTPQRFGPNVVQDLEAFSAMLGATRNAGFGEAVEEGEPGTAAVAVAIADLSGPGAGPIVGTLSLAGPLLRFGAERRVLLAARIARAAEELGAIWPLRQRPGTADMHAGRSAPAGPDHRGTPHGRYRVTAV